MALNPYDTPRGRFRTRVETTRRQFLLLMGGVGALGATIFGSVEVLKFMFPAVTGNAPPNFKTAFTFNDLTSAPVAVKSITDKRVTVVLDDAGIYAVYLVCTHLGCTPNYGTDVLTGSGIDPTKPDTKDHYAHGLAEGTGWACPCHGSRYYIDSTNFYGPAPRPMDWVDIQVTPDDHFEIDRSKLVVIRGAGDQTPPEWRLLTTTKKDNGKTLGV